MPPRAGDNAQRSGAGWVTARDRLHGRVVDRRRVVEMAPSHIQDSAVNGRGPDPARGASARVRVLLELTARTVGASRDQGVLTNLPIFTRGAAGGYGSAGTTVVWGWSSCDSVSVSGAGTVSGAGPLGGAGSTNPTDPRRWYISAWWCARTPARSRGRSMTVRCSWPPMAARRSRSTLRPASGWRSGVAGASGSTTTMSPRRRTRRAPARRRDRPRRDALIARFRSTWWRPRLRGSTPAGDDSRSEPRRACPS